MITFWVRVGSTVPRCEAGLMWFVLLWFYQGDSPAVGWVPSHADVDRNFGY